MSVMIERLETGMDYTHINSFYDGQVVAGIPNLLSVDVTFRCGDQDDYNELMDLFRISGYLPGQQPNQSNQSRESVKTETKVTKDIEPAEIGPEYDPENNLYETIGAIDIEL